MKKTNLILLSILLISLNLLIQWDMLTLLRNAISAVNEAETKAGIYLLWLLPTLINVGYDAILKSAVWVFLATDIIIAASAYLLVYAIRLKKQYRYNRYRY
jgi:hypothetical protein